MSRRTLFICLGALVVFIPQGCSDMQEPLQKGAAEIHQERPEGLAVTIWPESTRVQMGEFCNVLARVQNATVKPLSLWVDESCWFDHWIIETSDKRITGILPSLDACSGGPAIKKLAAGGVFEGVISVLLKNNDSVKDGPLPVLISLWAGFTPMDEPVKDFTLPELKSLRAGFPPIGEKKTYWSNRVVLGIKPGKHK